MGSIESGRALFGGKGGRPATDSDEKVRTRLAQMTSKSEKTTVTLG